VYKHGTAATQLGKLNPVILHNIRATYTEALHLFFRIYFSVLFYPFGMENGKTTKTKQSEIYYTIIKKIYFS
jgi:hypothetical protein